MLGCIELVKNRKTKEPLAPFNASMSEMKQMNQVTSKLRELGMKPLLVTATTCHLSKNGRQNLDNLKKLGFDTIEVSPNIKVRKILNKLCLELVGDIAWPEHVSIFTVPVQIALKFNIPLIILRIIEFFIIVIIHNEKAFLLNILNVFTKISIPRTPPTWIA